MKVLYRRLFFLCSTLLLVPLASCIKDEKANVECDIENIVVAQEDPRAAAHELRDLILKVRPHVVPEEVPEDRSATHALRASSPFLNIYQRV